MTTLGGSGPMADQARNHPVVQSLLGGIIGGRQIRLLQSRPDRLPIMQELARQSPGFSWPAC